MLSQSRQAHQGIRDKYFIYLIMHKVFFAALARLSFGLSHEFSRGALKIKRVVD